MPRTERFATARAVLGVILFCLGLYGATLHGYVDVEDTEIAYQATASLVERGTLEIRADTPLGREVIAGNYMVARGPDGRVYPSYPLAQVLLPVPFYLLGKRVAPLAREVPEDVVRLGFAAVNPVMGALLAVAILLAARALGASVRVAAVTAVCAASATMLWVYAQGTFTDLPLATCNTFAVLGLLRARERGWPWLLFAGLMQGMAGALRPIGFVLAVPAVWYLGRRWGRVATYLIACASVGALMLWLDVAVFGRPLAAGYAQRAAEGVLALTHSYTLTLFGLTFSDGMGLFTLSPVLLLALPGLAILRRQQAGAAWLLAGPCVLLVALFAAFTAWFGGNNWGPRYVLPAVPLLAIGMAPWLAQAQGWRRVVTGALWGASLLVQILGVAVPHRIYSVAIASVDADLTQAFFYTRFSPVLAHARILGHKLGGGDDVYTLRELFDLPDDRPLRVVEQPSPSIARFLRGFDHFAWVRIANKGHGALAVVGVGVCALLAALGVRLALRWPHPRPSARRNPNSDDST